MHHEYSSPGQKLRLAPGHRLDPGRSGRRPCLASPKGAVQLNVTAARVLTLCDGTHTREEILERVLPAEGDHLAPDLRSFLDAAQRRGWIREA